MIQRIFDWLDARTNYRRLTAPIRERILPDGPSWWFTSASCLLWVFVIELITGFLLMTTYSPSTNSAWASVHYIELSSAGSFIRGVHYFASHVLIVLFAIHVIRVLLMGAFRAPRELIWITGLLLLPLIIVWAVTGNPLSASQKGMAQIEVEGNIIGSTPVIGPAMQRILIGGEEVGHLTLTHLNFLHVGLLPLLILLLLSLHLTQVYRHGLSPVVRRGSGRACSYWPYQTIRNMTVLSAVMVVIALLAWRHGAPLDAPADSNLATVPRPEWYFRCLFELRRHFTGDWEFVATLVLPLSALLFFLSLPILDRLLARRASIALRGLVVMGGVAGWGWLTWTSFSRDWKDADYLAAQEQAAEHATRARTLADQEKIPPEGAMALLRDDPKTQGPVLFARHCASCHSHVDSQGRGIVAAEPSAPNLHGFGTTDWIAGLMDQDRINSPHYFARTKFANGDMASKVQEIFQEAEGDIAALRKKIQQMSQALSAEASLDHANTFPDERSADTFVAGRNLITGEFGCTDCHRFRDQGNLGSAPDLTGYGSRDWLSEMISDPQGERFYPGDRNDRMPSFAKEPLHPQRNLLNSRELRLLVDWLRSEWYEAPGSDSLSPSQLRHTNVAETP